MRSFLAAAFLFISIAACARDPAGRAAPTDVAMTRLAFVDAVRADWAGTGPRPLAVTVWHPASAAVKAPAIVSPADQPIFFGGFAQEGAAPAPGRHPLVLLSHGAGASAFDLMWLGRRLAAAGFIAAAVDHHGASAAEPSFDARAFQMPGERPRDLSAVLDRLLGDATFGPRIDSERIAAAGVAAGGIAALQLVGGRADPDIFAAFCRSAEADATCGTERAFSEAQAEFARLLAADGALRARAAEARNSFRDPRVKAAIALAPAPGQLLTAESLFAIGAPVLVIAGNADRAAPAGANAARIAGLVAKARLETFDGAGHDSLLNTCTEYGRRAAPLCRDAPGFDREAFHDRLAGDVAKFLDAAFGPRP